jgi:hypothetical protein
MGFPNMGSKTLPGSRVEDILHWTTAMTISSCPRVFCAEFASSHSHSRAALNRCHDV